MPLHVDVHTSVSHHQSNRINQVVEPSGNTKYKLITPHHKNSWRGIIGNSITLQDNVMHQLLSLYLEYGRPLLLVANPNLEELFFNNKGNPLQHPHITQWFKDFQTMYHPPLPEGTCPSIFRHSFANEVMEASQQGMGPTVEQAARMMGNSPGTLVRVRVSGECHACHGMSKATS